MLDFILPESHWILQWNTSNIVVSIAEVSQMQMMRISLKTRFLRPVLK